MSQQRVKVYKYCNNHIKVNRIRIYFNVCNAMINNRIDFMIQRRHDISILDQIEINNIKLSVRDKFTLSL